MQKAGFFIRTFILTDLSTSIQPLELLEGLLVACRLGDLEGVEFDGLREGAALAHGQNVAHLDVPEKAERNKRLVLVC